MRYAALVLVGLVVGCVGEVGDPAPSGLAAVDAPDDALAPHETQRIIVQYRLPERRRDVEASERLALARSLEPIGALVYEVSADDTPSEVVDRLRATQGALVEGVEVDTIAFPASTPNDPLFPNEWHLPKLEVPLAWDTTQGAGVTIAILDTGTNCAHQDLAPNCVAGWNTANQNSDTSDLNGHGTATAGTAASAGDNGLGGAGVAYRSKIMPIRITPDSTGSATCSAIADAIIYAADHGAKVASNSYYIIGCTVTNTAAAYLAGKGGLYVRAMGNDGLQVDTPPDPNIIHVSATDSNDVKTSWSNYGQAVDVAAPGTPIYCTTLSGGYGNCWGTSFSVPIVSGTLALMYAANPSLSADQARSILFSSAEDLGSAGWDAQYGWGRVNARRAVELARSTSGGFDTLAPSVPTELAASSVSATGVTLRWTASVDNVLVTQYVVFRDGARHATLSATTSYTDGAAAPESTYTYAVAARDAAGNESAPSAAVTVTTPAAPFAVTSVFVSSKTTGVATVTSTTSAPATVVVRYGLSASTLTASVAGAPTASTSQTVTLTGLERRKRYFYQVVATSPDGRTATSAVSNFRSR